jgi:hypothetical protein
MVRHKTEDVVIHVTEEVNFWLYSPVVLHVCQSRVFVEEPTVPSAHLMVGLQGSVLYVVFS